MFCPVFIKSSCWCGVQREKGERGVSPGNPRQGTFSLKNKILKITFF